MLYVKTENLVQLGSILKNLVLKNEEGIGLEKKRIISVRFFAKKKATETSNPLQSASAWAG